MNNFNITRLNYTKKGEKNKKMNNKFIKICKMAQKQLKKFLENELKKYYKNVISQDGFLYVKGKDKVCLTAHMDTVHSNLIKDYYVLKENGKTIVSSPQGIGGDDRCGIYMILTILEKTKFRPTIIFCEDEEIGGVGSNKFCNTKFINDLKKMYCLIELDRKGSNDLVYYSDINEEFHKYVENVTGYNESFGSFSDISHLSPACGISSVNISCGYYNAHTTDEYVVMEEMNNSIERTIDIIASMLKDKKQFKYEKRVYKPIRYEDDYEYYYPSRWQRTFQEEKEISLYIQYELDGVELDEFVSGKTEDECWGKFFTLNTSICFNDVKDYEIYNDDDYDSYLNSYFGKSI